MTSNFAQAQEKIAYTPKFFQLYNESNKIPYTDEEYRKLYKYLPDIVLKKNGLLPQEITINDYGNYGLLVQEYREIFPVIAYWLFEVIDSSKPENNEQIKTTIEIKIPFNFVKSDDQSALPWEFEYIHLAQRSWNIFQLCQHILERDPSNWQENYEGLTATIMWFNYEMEMLENSFKSNGLLDKFNLVGKENIYKENKKKQKIMGSLVNQMNPNYELLYEEEIKNKPKTESISQSIWAYALLIAEKDDYFHWHILLPIWKSMSKIERYYRDNSNFQVIGLTENNKIWIGGNGKRGKGKN